MRGESHRRLGKYLASRYMCSVPGLYVKAFLIGCIEPDRNPVTYLKGSFRCQWLRGHNYHNARRFMRKLSRRLEKKESFGLYDFYSLGKLIHYTADAFTYAHNAHFPTQLTDHMAYEAELQEHFLAYLSADPQVDTVVACNIMDAICSCHRDYEQAASNIHTDTRFALTACCCVVALLFAKPVL